MKNVPRDLIHLSKILTDFGALEIFFFTVEFATFLEAEMSKKMKNGCGAHPAKGGRSP
jgi:hypothetical protein